MAKFSSRYGYDPKDSTTPVIEEAPEWLRTIYVRNILTPLTYIDRDSRYPNEEGSPLGIKDLGETFSLMLRRMPEDALFDSWVCSDALSGMVQGVEWYHFYDFVELVARQLLTIETADLDDTWIKRFGLKQYAAKVNALFKSENVVWRFNTRCELVREIPAAYTKTLNKVDASLKGEFAPSREHYLKARRFIYERPLDPENGIKEIVSAIESAGKILIPGTSTLGDVAKQLRGDTKVPRGLVSVIEKFYAYASSEPAVRHGGAVDSKVSLHDAEFCLHVGVALIRYLLIKHGKSD
ncbi:MAG: hypothetical protein JWN94_1032 [Betaproteobacteria bacterium]|nr:hypothetical protein [Betaproteobacteria bacterium]